MRSWLLALRPWLALLCLYALFELPCAVVGEPLHPAADLALLLVLYIASLRLPRVGRALRIALGACAVVLAFYRLDRAMFIAFMQQEPPLYDQLFMARHLFVLFADLWNWRVGAGLLAGACAIALLVWLCGVLLRGLRDFDERLRQRRVGLAIACGAVAAATWLPQQLSHGPHWITPGLLANIEQSGALYASVQRQLRSSPYRRFDSLHLRRRPDIYLLIVESYGRAMLQREQLKPQWQAQMQQMEASLGDAGWHTASAFSVAPVSGGRSWLADGTVMMGIHVEYESVFHHLVSQIERVPNLAGALAKQGYHTIALAPSDRKRLGVEEVNYYGYQRMVRFDDLQYVGPKMGWGIVPDQYSLSFTEENFLRGSPRPLFLNYHMVTSHAPWQSVPTLVDDWRSLSRATRSSGKHRPGREVNATWRRLRRYGKETPPEVADESMTAKLLRGYQQTVSYDLELLERYLASMQGDSLVLVMGDHQPPLIAGEKFGLDTPVHVFARDPALLQEFTQHGFKAGLQLDENAAAATRHEQLFALIMGALTRCCDDAAVPPESTRALVPVDPAQPAPIARLPTP